MQPPQAKGDAERDATTRVAAAAYRGATGHAADPELAPRLGNAAHYAFAAGLGLCYGLARPRAPWLGSGYGLAYATAIWAVADQGVMPAMGLSKGPRQLSTPVLMYSLAGHWVFGATLECVMRMSDPAATRALLEDRRP